MKYTSNKGFVLAETLVVAVAVAAIFAIIFRNYYPLIGEYERREDYDDIDSKYGTYWFKRIIQSVDYQLDEASIRDNGYVKFSCDSITDERKKNICYQMLESLEVSCDNPSTKEYVESCSNHSYQPNIYIMDYNLTTFKGKVNDIDSSFSLREYVEYLPQYSKVESLNNAKYRLIVEYYRHRFDTAYYKDGDPENPTEHFDLFEKDEDDYYTFATIEVKK